MKKELIKQAVSFLLNYTSNVIEKTLPDNPEPKELELIQNTTLTTYAAAKSFGIDIVADTENKYDDKLISELIESCEETSDKYGFSLDATQW